MLKRPSSSQIGHKAVPLLTPLESARLAVRWDGRVPLSNLDQWWRDSDPSPYEASAMLVDIDGELAAVGGWYKYNRSMSRDHKGGFVWSKTEIPEEERCWDFLVRDPLSKEACQLAETWDNCLDWKWQGDFDYAMLFHVQWLAEQRGWRFAYPLPDGWRRNLIRRLAAKPETEVTEANDGDYPRPSES